MAYLNIKILDSDYDPLVNSDEELQKFISDLKKQGVNILVGLPSSSGLKSRINSLTDLENIKARAGEPDSWTLKMFFSALLTARLLEKIHDEDIRLLNNFPISLFLRKLGAGLLLTRDEYFYSGLIETFIWLKSKASQKNFRPDLSPV